MSSSKKITFPLFNFPDRREGHGVLPVFKEDPQINPPVVEMDIGIDFALTFCNNSLKSPLRCTDNLKEG